MPSVIESVQLLLEIAEYFLVGLFDAVNFCDVFVLDFFDGLLKGLALNFKLVLILYIFILLYDVLSLQSLVLVVHLLVGALQLRELILNLLVFGGENLQALVDLHLGDLVLYDLLLYLVLIPH